MSHSTAVNALLLAAAMVSAGCSSQAQDQSPSAAENPKGSSIESGAAKKAPSPPKPLSPDAAAPTGEPKDKEKRGNTPPGKDRAGEGPASGAILDPSGVTQK